MNEGLLSSRTAIGTFPQAHNELPTGFVDVSVVVPDAIFDMRYASSDNFIGSPIDGYESMRCILTEKAAKALYQVNQQLLLSGSRLRIYDCYRPQRAVDHFIRWARDLRDERRKKEYYPHEDKRDLFEKGYLVRRSTHSRGSTVDLTIDGLDMGTPWDFFADASHTAYAGLTPEQKNNRERLVSLMEQFGFENYPQEWWHFTLKDEPFPNTYFDFPIR